MVIVFIGDIGYRSIGDIGNMMDLENKAITVRAPRMGRPPLGVKATLVRLTADALLRIDALVGSGRRAEFIREAVERELKRRERNRD